MSYTDVFGGANIYPSEISYSSTTLIADITLSWPEETSASINLATRIMDVTPTVSGRSIILPDATKASPGETILFNNKGALDFIVKNSAGVQIVYIPSGTVWQIYLTSNSTAGGTWVSLQYGAALASANASALAGTGIVAVGTLLSQSVPTTSFNSNYSAGINDRARMFIWQGSSGTFTMPTAATVGNNWFCYVRNSGTGAVSVNTPGTSLIDGLASLSFQPGESAIVATDGSNFYTIGFGKSAIFAFDYTVIDVPGSGNYTLSGTELNRIVYKFTGVLTGVRNIIVPSTVQQYWIDNQTTGSFAFNIRTASGSSLILATGQRAIFYCDGSGMVDADTSTVSLPVLINQGGTGAVSASAARINLGATSVGDSIFTASSTASVYAALGNIPILSGGVF